MLLFEQGTSAPTAPSAQPYTWHRRVRVLQAATPAALETAINAFQTTLENDATYRFGAIIGDIDFQMPELDKLTVIISYGYFTTP